MQAVIIVLHLLLVVSLIAIILLQRSEGGGFGTSNNNANFMSARGSKNALTRLTAILAGAFFFTSLLLVILDSVSNSSSDILKHIPVGKEKAPVQVNKTEEQKIVVPSGGTAPVVPQAAPSKGATSNNEGSQNLPSSQVVPPAQDKETPKNTSVHIENVAPMTSAPIKAPSAINPDVQKGTIPLSKEPPEKVDRKNNAEDQKHHSNVNVDVKEKK